MSFAKLIQEALEASDSASPNRIAPEIAVVGCGGGGCNSIQRLKRIGLEGVTTIALNTDRYHLSGIAADKKIFIGENVTKGYGTGGDLSLAEKCARDFQDSIAQAVSGADLIFITAGMGGGTGTGVSPIVAEIGCRNGALVVALVTTPFSFERGRLNTAQRGVSKLNEIAHCTVVLDNNKLLDIAPKLPIERAFTVMDHLIAETIKGFSETISEPSMINLDFSDFRSIMSVGGIGTMLFGESEDVKELVDEALSNPFLEVDFSEANGALIHITGGSELPLKRVHQIFKGIVDALPSARNVKFGARVRTDRSRMINVMGIVTGVKPRIDDFLSEPASENARQRESKLARA